MQSENTVGTEPTPNDDTNLGSLEDLAELVLEPEDAGASTIEDGGSQETPINKFNDLSEKLGLELDDLYKLEISQAEDGTPVTVENLKDQYAKQGDLTLREIEFEERKTEQEASLMQAQEELRELMAALPEKAISPEVLQKVRDKHTAQVTLERQKTLEVIPSWQDEATRTKDIEGMAEHLKQYGYPVNHLERIADHRQLKYIRDNWQREQRIRQALAKVKAGKPAPTPQSKPASKAPSKRPLTGVNRGNSHNPLEAIFSDL